MSRPSARLALLSLLVCVVTVARGQGSAFANLNNGVVNARFTSWGLIGMNPGTASPAFEVPQGGGNHPLFSSGFWIAGMDPQNQPRVAALMYETAGNGDFWPGPLTTDGTASITQATAQAYDQVWCVNRAEVDLHLAYFDCLADPGCDAAVQFPGYQASPSLLQWPALGDVSAGVAFYQAPFVDRNADGDYNPADGDVPCFLGDKACFTVYNDQKTHLLTGSQPLGIEVKAMPFVYLTGDPALASTVFLNLQLVNRSSTTYSDTHLGLFTDFDLGYYGDDMIGTDAARNLWYVYNADNLDEGSTSGPGYGVQPPAFGVVMLKGPLADPDILDNPAAGILPAWNGRGFGDGIVDNERMGLSWTRYFNNSVGPMGNPSVASDFVNYLGQFWKDGTPQSYGGTGYSTTPGAVPARFVYPGGSDPVGAGTGGSPQPVWTELSAGNPPGDRRMLGAAGPITLEPGEHVNLTFAYVYARASTGGPTASITALQQRVDSVRAFANDLPIWSAGEVSTLFEACVLEPGNSTREIFAEEQLRFFPVPTEELVRLECPRGLAGERLSLYDAMGRMVRTHVLVEGRNTIAIQDLPSGVYIARVNAPSARYVGRVVKE